MSYFTLSRQGEVLDGYLGADKAAGAYYVAAYRGLGGGAAIGSTSRRGSDSPAYEGFIAARREGGGPHAVIRGLGDLSAVLRSGRYPGPVLPVVRPSRTGGVSAPFARWGYLPGYDALRARGGYLPGYDHQGLRGVAEDITGQIETSQDPGIATSVTYPDILTSQNLVQPGDLTPAGQPIAGAQQLETSQAATFTRYWAEFQTAWADLQRMGAEIREHKQRWLAVQAAADAAGDGAGTVQATQQYAAVTELETLYNQVMDTVARYLSYWTQLRDYIASAGAWFGLSGLGLVPLLLAVAIPVVIASLAWVIVQYRKLRTQLTLDAQILASAEAGRITGPAAAAMIAAQRGGAATATPLSSVADLVKWGVVGLGVWIAWGALSKRGVT